MIEKWLDSIKTGFSLLRPFGVELANIVGWLGENYPKTTLIVVGAYFLWRYNENAARKCNLMKMRLLEERGKVSTKIGFAAVAAFFIFLFVAGSFATRGKNPIRTAATQVAASQKSTTRPGAPPRKPAPVIYSLPERKTPK